jgi:hypothetical protein
VVSSNSKPLPIPVFLATSVTNGKHHMTPDNLKADFDEIFKGIVVPFFKGLGFKRKAQHFARQTNEITQCFNVQKSQWNSYYDSLSFTFNLGFYNETIRTLAWGQEMSTDLPKTTDCFIQHRLGFYSHEHDHWYKLGNRADRQRVAEQVKGDLEKHLRPLLENYQSLNDLRNFFKENNGFFLSPYVQIVFLMITGQNEKGKLFIKEQHKISLTPQITTQTVNYPDGSSEVKTSKPYINHHYIDELERLAKHYNIEL